MSTPEQKPIFRDLSGEDPDPEVTEVESMCMNCYKNGMTRLLLTRIPYYKNVVLMSFSCEHCGTENNEIQPGGAYAACGVRWELKVSTSEDMNRQVVKSDFTGVTIPELEFEIPPQSQKGEVTTVEGIVSRAIAGLTQDQDRRREEHPAAAAQIEAIAERLGALRDLQEPWTLVLDDISGNCYVENPCAPARDPRCFQHDYPRTIQQDHALGIYNPDEVWLANIFDRIITYQQVSKSSATPSSSLLTPVDPASHTFDKMAAEEVLQFRTNCPECNAPADTNMKVTKIPHFKEVIIMATICDVCGHRTNEVKSGGGVEEKGVKFEVRVAGKQDFSRDILKSETCSMEVPELELEVGGRALGGRFSTAEGLLLAMRDQLKAAPGAAGDAPGLNATALHSVIDRLDEVLRCEEHVTLVLDDPAGNSYVQSLNDDNTPDDGLKITRYERSFEQNEELGLNDIKTENYE